MRGTAALLRGPRPVAAIRDRVPGILRSARAAAQSHHCLVNDRLPSSNLIFHEWDRHGTCAGVPANIYFDNVRKARAVVKIPPQYRDVSSSLTVTPQEVTDAFIKANPGLTAEAISISCASPPRLDEVRICMTRDFRFRDCPEAERRSCRRDQLVMPPSVVSSQ
jgi:ribonuclease T2